MRLCRRALGSVSENGLLPLSTAETRSFDCAAPLVCGGARVGVLGRGVQRDSASTGDKTWSWPGSPLRLVGLLYSARVCRRRMAVVCALLCSLPRRHPTYALAAHGVDAATGATYLPTWAEFLVHARAASVFASARHGGVERSSGLWAHVEDADEHALNTFGCNPWILERGILRERERRGRETEL